MLVHVYAQRHGQKEKSNDPLDRKVALTPEGREQVRVQAEKHLRGICFKEWLYSGVIRTKETDRIALGVVHPDEADLIEEIITRDEIFGYDYLCDYPGFLDECRMAEIAIEMGEPDTLGLWLKCCPRAVTTARVFVRERLLCIARRITEPGQAIYVASHSSIAEAAAPNPENTPTLKLGQIAHYTIEINGDNARIMDFEELPLE